MLRTTQEKFPTPPFTCLLRLLALAQPLITTACYHPASKTWSFNLYLALPKKLTGASAAIVKCSLCTATAWQRADLRWNEQGWALLHNNALQQLLPDGCKCSVSLPPNGNCSFQIFYSIQRLRVLFNWCWQERKRKLNSPSSFVLSASSNRDEAIRVIGKSTVLLRHMVRTWFSGLLSKLYSSVSVTCAVLLFSHIIERLIFHC